MKDAVLVSLLLALLSSASAGAGESARDSEWTSYNGTVDGQRFAPEEEINVQNASQLKEVCRARVDEAGSFHTGLLQIGGLIYLTTPLDTLAIDAADCSVRWRHRYALQQDPVWLVNRGVAYASGRIFRGTPDGRLMALDVLSGKTLWQHQIGDPRQGEFFSAAPQVYQGLVIIGAAGGDWAIRGRVMAFDAETGREVWRFNTIPRGDEAGAETWKDRKTARHGGGGTWTTYTLDMASGELFVPVGNPAPDFIPTLRPGDNLYSNSLVVLDARTGALRWYHQLISNDGQDLDLGAAPMLYFNSKGEPIVTFGSKDGYVYGVNRETHKRVFKTPITSIKNHGVPITPEGVELCPGPLGGVEWNGPAWDQKNKSILVGTVDWCALVTREKDFKLNPGQFNMGGSWTFPGPGKGWVVALEPDRGEIRWKYETAGPQVAGVTPTAGGVTFSGDMLGNFYALESATGKELFKAPTGGAMAGGVITYTLRGRQFVAFASGNLSRFTFGEIGKPTLVLYALDTSPESTGTPSSSDPTSKSAADASLGKSVFAKTCAACHGTQGEGGVGPSLKGLRDRMTVDRTIDWIKNPSAKMPALFPSTLTEKDVADVAAYVQGL